MTEPWYYEYLRQHHDTLTISQASVKIGLCYLATYQLQDKLNIKFKKSRKEDKPIMYNPKIDSALLCFLGVDNRPNQIDRNVTYNGHGSYT